MKHCEIRKSNDKNEMSTLVEELNKKPRKYKMEKSKIIRILTLQNIIKKTAKGPKTYA